MWQGALRHPEDPIRAATAEAIETRQPITIELLYSDQVGQQRTITRFALIPTGDAWLASVGRHWYLDWDGPRPESGVRSAADMIFREIEAAAGQQHEEVTAARDRRSGRCGRRQRLKAAKARL